MSTLILHKSMSQAFSVLAIVSMINKVTQRMNSTDMTDGIAGPSAICHAFCATSLNRSNMACIPQGTLVEKS